MVGKGSGVEGETTLRVEPHGGNWVIRQDDLEPPLGTFPTAEEAERRARELAAPLSGRVEVSDDRRWAPEEAVTGGDGGGAQVDGSGAERAGQ